MNPRAIAALALTHVVKEGRSLTEVLPASSLAKALCYETLRWYFQLQYLLSQLLEKPLKPKDTDITLLMMIGLCQLLHLRTPDHVAVTETVNAAQDLKKPWASQLINAVLRNFLRRKDELLNNIHSPATLFAHPNWLIKMLKQASPKNWEAILQANNQHPPLSLRVNLQKISRALFLQQLQAANICAHISPYSDAGVILDTPCDVASIPGFSAGQCSVQDISPQLAPALLDLKKGLYVLDACAAPGGKTMHILETEPLLARLVALDISATRLRQAQDTEQRLGLPHKIDWIVNDAQRPDLWWDGQPFDRILLDAPCSATGVIRRHPDIKLLRKPEDIPRLARQQLALLNALWPTLCPGGILLYATCSVLPQENSEVIQQFLAEHHDAREIKIERNQILPGQDNMDGFYYAKLLKKPHPSHQKPAR